MKIRNVTQEQVRDAARAACVGLRDIDQRGAAVQVTLAPLGGDVYRRIGQSANANGRRRRINAVCFHGHLAFMRALYALAPSAIIRSGLRLMGQNEVVYRSLADLEWIGPAVGEINIGSMAHPLALEDACVCMDWNVGGVRPDWARLARTEPETYAAALAA